MKRSILRFKLVVLLALAVTLPAVAQKYDEQKANAPREAQSVVRYPFSEQTAKNQVPRADVSTKLHVTWKSGNPDARTIYTEAVETGGAWSKQAPVIGATSNGTYHTSAVAYNPRSGLTHLVWVDLSQGGNGHLFHAFRDGNGNWSAPVRVSGRGNFVHFPHATVDSAGRVWAIWSVENPDRDAVIARYSADNGQSWSQEFVLSTNGAKRPWIAADKSGGVHAVWWAEDGFIHYGHSQNGGAFNITPLYASGFNADPTITVAPDGTLHAAWRRQASHAQWDIYWATKPAGGGWHAQKLYSGANINYSVPIFADNQGVIHLAWMEPFATTSDIIYTYKRPGAGWAGPQNLTNDGPNQFNLDVVGRGDGTSSRSHIFVESWTGGENDTDIEHIAVLNPPVGSSPPPPPPPSPTPPPAKPVQALPVLEGGAAFTKKSDDLTAHFNSVTGDPNQIRYSWDAPPTNSSPWRAFGNPMTIDVPPGMVPWRCYTRNLFTQARNTATGMVEQSPKADTITFDTAVLAASSIDSRDGRAASGWIRTPHFGYRVFWEPWNCSGVAKYVALNTFDDYHPGTDSSLKVVKFQTGNWPTEGNGFAERDVPARVAIIDKAGNVRVAERMLAFDDDAPSLSAGSLSASNNNGNRPMAQLSFSTVVVTDDRYGVASGQPTRAYRALWVLVSNTDLGNAPTVQQFVNQQAYVIPVWPGQTNAAVSLVSNDQNPSMSPGQRYIYVRFLDGAGNPTPQVLRATVNLERDYPYTRQLLPAVPNSGGRW